MNIGKDQNDFRFHRKWIIEMINDDPIWVSFVNVSGFPCWKYRRQQKYFVLRNQLRTINNSWFKSV